MYYFDKWIKSQLSNHSSFKYDSPDLYNLGSYSISSPTISDFSDNNSSAFRVSQLFFHFR